MNNPKARRDCLRLYPNRREKCARSSLMRLCSFSLLITLLTACVVSPLWSTPTRPAKWDEPRYLEAYDKVLKAANRWGKVAGLPTNTSNNPGNIDWAIERGFKMVTVGDADTFMIEGARAALDRAREAASKVKLP